MSKPKARLTTRAIVTLTIEVTVGSWSEDCPASQVYSQASEEARRLVERLADAHCRVLPNTVSVRSITTDMELKA